MNQAKWKILKLVPSEKLRKENGGEVGEITLAMLYIDARNTSISIH